MEEQNPKTFWRRDSDIWERPLQASRESWVEDLHQEPNTFPQNTPEPVEKTSYNPELSPKAPEVKREFMFHPSLTAKPEPMYKPKFKLMPEPEPMAKPTPVLAPCSMLIKAPCSTCASLHVTACCRAYRARSDTRRRAYQARSGTYHRAYGAWGKPVAELSHSTLVPEVTPESVRPCLWSCPSYCVDYWLVQTGILPDQQV